MKISREELDELLQRADRARTRLRRATIDLQALGDQLMATRQKHDDVRSR